MNELFKKRAISYFGNDHELFLESLSQEHKSGFFLNEKKADKKTIFEMIDFPYHSTILTSASFYHNEENIGKTLAYDLGLIYPQDIESALPVYYLPEGDYKLVLDLCAAPGGKSINILNKIGDDSLLISNDISYKRAQVLSSNLERSGFGNVIVSNNEPKDLCYLLRNACDLVILDAPCSGEGMIRKYPEILDDYNEGNIVKCASIQSELLDQAYSALKEGGVLLYSTCTYSFEEDEEQVRSFLNKYPDMELLEAPKINNNHSVLQGTIKLSPLNDTEGQFMTYFKKNSGGVSKYKTLKTVRDKEVETFISDNLNIEKYYLYKQNDHYYLSLIELPNLNGHILRYGIYLGDKEGKRFVPVHSLYRNNDLIFKYKYDLNYEELIKYLNGYELKVYLDNNYYQLTYYGLSVGFGKVSNNVLKNKYPKGLRRMIK